MSCKKNTAWAAGILATSLSVGCVTTGTHTAVVDELSRTKESLVKTGDERDTLKKKSDECTTDLTTALDQNQQLVTKVSSMGQNVEQLLGEKGELTQQRERMATEQQTLAKEIEELRRVRAASEARNAQYKRILEKLHKMIDAGTLQVKIRSGRMLVQMPSDVVFPAGSTRIKPEATEAITELARTIKEFPDRKFQVVGHSDSTPIHSARFPSNWELSTQRAIEVVRLMVEAGVPPQMLSAAGQAEFDPIVPDSDENPDAKTMNRRVELVFMPSINELPGFDDVAGTPAKP
ncbi:MAG: OmpA family protein [Myxococcota bacterium]